MSELYIGILSGTSMDAIDAVLVDFSKQPFELVASHSEEFPPTIKTELQALCHPGHDEINRFGQLDQRLGKLFAHACLKLLEKTSHRAQDIRAIGSHGQTIRHQPNLDSPFTLQIGDPNLIAELTGITTVADFRRRDIACGGQGAPLTPGFHAFAFRSSDVDRIVVNIGGIANITLLPADSSKPLIGFDSGPGNTLLDCYISRQLGKAFDQDGAWSSSGVVDEQLLQQMLADDYFTLPPPKSTGKEYFNLAWLDVFLAGKDYQPVNIQSTLAELTAKTISLAINSASLSAGEILLCGGGTENIDLIKRISASKGEFTVTTTKDYGVDPNWVEGIAFAWLARQTMIQSAGNLPEVTGARCQTILGGVFQSYRSN